MTRLEDQTFARSPLSGCWSGSLIRSGFPIPQLLTPPMLFPRSLSILVTLAVVLSGIVLLIFSEQIDWTLYPRFLLFISAIVVASQLAIVDPAGGILRPTGTVFCVVFSLFDPPTSLFIVSVGQALGSTLTRGWVTWRAIFNAGQLGLSVFFGSLIYRILGGNPLDQNLPMQFVLTLAGAFAYHVSNDFFVSLFFSQVRRLRFTSNWLATMRSLSVFNMLGIPTAVLITALYTRVSPLSLVLLFAIPPIGSLVLRSYLAERSVYGRIIESLVRATEFNDPKARGHARRVADISVRIARELGLVEREVESIEFASLLHDLGMIAFDDPDATRDLSVEARVRAHAETGAEIARELQRKEIAEMIRHHHVSYEEGSVGKGAISLGSHIISLAEQVDSRLHGLFPYFEPQKLLHIVDEVRRGKGTMFHPEVVDAFLRTVEPSGGVSSETSQSAPESVPADSGA